MVRIIWCLFTRDIEVFYGIHPKGRYNVKTSLFMQRWFNSVWNTFLFSDKPNQVVGPKFFPCKQLHEGNFPHTKVRSVSILKAKLYSEVMASSSLWIQMLSVSADPSILQESRKWPLQWHRGRCSVFIYFYAFIHVLLVAWFKCCCSKLRS